MARSRAAFTKERICAYEAWKVEAARVHAANEEEKTRVGAWEKLEEAALRCAADHIQQILRQASDSAGEKNSLPAAEVRERISWAFGAFASRAREERTHWTKVREEAHMEASVVRESWDRALAKWREHSETTALKREGEQQKWLRSCYKDGDLRIRKEWANEEKQLIDESRRRAEEDVEAFQNEDARRTRTYELKVWASTEWQDERARIRKVYEQSMDESRVAWDRFLHALIASYELAKEKFEADSADAVEMFEHAREHIGIRVGKWQINRWKSIEGALHDAVEASFGDFRNACVSVVDTQTTDAVGENARKSVSKSHSVLLAEEIESAVKQGAFVEDQVMEMMSVAREFRDNASAKAAKVARQDALGVKNFAADRKKIAEGEWARAEASAEDFEERHRYTLDTQLAGVFGGDAVGAAGRAETLQNGVVRIQSSIRGHLARRRSDQVTEPEDVQETKDASSTSDAGTREDVKAEAKAKILETKAEFVGRRVAVFWEDEGRSYEAKIKDHDPEQGWFLEYDDGDTEWMQAPFEGTLIVESDQQADEADEEDEYDDDYEDEQYEDDQDEDQEQVQLEESDHDPAQEQEQEIGGEEVAHANATQGSFVPSGNDDVASELDVSTAAIQGLWSMARMRSEISLRAREEHAARHSTLLGQLFRSVSKTQEDQTASTRERLEKFANQRERQEQLDEKRIEEYWQWRQEASKERIDFFFRSLSQEIRTEFSALGRVLEQNFQSVNDGERSGDRFIADLNGAFAKEHQVHADDHSVRGVFINAAAEEGSEATASAQAKSQSHVDSVVLSMRTAREGDKVSPKEFVQGSFEECKNKLDVWRKSVKHAFEQAEEKTQNARAKSQTLKQTAETAAEDARANVNRAMEAVSRKTEKDCRKMLFESNQEARQVLDDTRNDVMDIRESVLEGTTSLVLELRKKIEIASNDLKDMMAKQEEQANKCWSEHEETLFQVHSDAKASLRLLSDGRSGKIKQIGVGERQRAVVADAALADQVDQWFKESDDRRQNHAEHGTEHRSLVLARERNAGIATAQVTLGKMRTDMAEYKQCIVKASASGLTTNEFAEEEVRNMEESFEYIIRDRESRCHDAWELIQQQFVNTETDAKASHALRLRRIRTLYHDGAVKSALDSLLDEVEHREILHTKLFDLDFDQSTVFAQHTGTFQHEKAEDEELRAAYASELRESMETDVASKVSSCQENGAEWRGMITVLIDGLNADIEALDGEIEAELKRVEAEEAAANKRGFRRVTGALTGFGKMFKPFQNAISNIAEGMIDEDGNIDRIKLQEAFNKVDADGSGTIDAKEFTTLMHGAGLKEITDTQIHDILVELDADGSGTLDFEEFTIAVERSVGLDQTPADLSIIAKDLFDANGNLSRPKLRECFENIDKDNSGTVDASEFTTLLRSSGLHHISDEEVGEIIAALDADGSGTLDFEEFSVAVKQSAGMDHRDRETSE